MSENESVQLKFTPFSSEIIGADEKFVFLKEVNMATEEYNKTFVVLKIKVPLFIKTVKKWITTKAEYCNTYKHFCGVFGDFTVKEYKERGTINLLVGFKFNDEIENPIHSPIYKDVPLYEVIKIDLICDMEHG